MTFIQRIQFTSSTGYAGRTFTAEALRIRPTSASILTGRRVTFGIGIAVLARESWWTHTAVTFFTINADPSVVTRRFLAKVDLVLAVPAHETRFAVTSVVIHELNAVESSSRITRIG